MENQLTTMLATECVNLETEADSLRQQMENARNRLREIEVRLVHIRALLGQDDNVNAHNGPLLASSSKPNGHGPTLCDIAAEVLRERGRDPMYYKELAAEVIKRGGLLGGKTPEATLTARLVRDERFVRPTSKGFYALREHYPNARNVGARKRPLATVRRNILNQPS